MSLALRDLADFSKENLALLGIKTGLLKPKHSIMK
jgi:hypothetical protein